jgi:hypothetical protein
MWESSNSGGALRDGPKLEVVAHCTGCKWLREEIVNGMIYNGRQLMLCESRCTHENGPAERFSVGANPRTPGSCPLLPSATAAFLDKAHMA